MTITIEPDIEELLSKPPQPLEKLSRDVRKALHSEAKTLGREQVGELVDLYYRTQKTRVALGNQSGALTRDDRPAEVVDHFALNYATLEAQVKGVLEAWVKANPVGRWLLDIKGIGPVLAANLLAQIDIEKAPTVGHIWRFAGLDPTVKWSKGEKRPWNDRLKKTCWLIGDSFVKVSNREVGPGEINYGTFYRSRKEQELRKNEAGDFAAQAADTLATRNITDRALRATLEAGQLPLGRLELRARRYAVKLFLSHLHHVMHVQHYGVEPPKPYALTQAGGHAHYIAPPSFNREL
jgi:hypothetical protein